MIAYEQITDLPRQKSIWKSAKILTDGWSRRNYDTLDLTKPIPWALSDPDLRSYNFYLHCLDMLDPLLAAHSHTGDLNTLLPALRIGLDWVSKHRRGVICVSPMAWYDMAVGMRAYRLGYLFQAADEAGLLDVTSRSALWSSLLDHCVELFDDANIAFHNNHGYFQVAGQLALGRRFADVSAPMAALHAQGSTRLKRMLDQQFGHDGVHREHSPDYHRMVADTLLGLVRAGLVEDSDLLSRVDEIEDALAWFVKPDGTITNFGDSDSRSMIYSAEGASRKWTTPLMRAVASNGAAGSGWPKGLSVFAESGYAVVRMPDLAQPDEITRDSYLAQTAAFHSRTHKHCDDLSFVWHDVGQPLLVDAGRYGYIGKTETGSDLWRDGFWYSDPMRVYMECTRAHNTLEFDGKNALRKGVKPYGSALVQAFDRDGVFCIETRCKQHGSIWHDRVLMFKPGQWLVVFDVFTDNLKQPHEVKQWFHLAPGHKAKAVAGGYDVTLRDGTAMVVRSLLGNPEITQVISGRLEDPIQGWWSEKERSVEPADAIAFGVTGCAKGVFATLFSLVPHVVVDLDTGKTNVTGRKAKLAWQDESGVHVLDFERADRFSLSYEFKELETVVSSCSTIKEPASEINLFLGQYNTVLEYGIGPVAHAVASAFSAVLVICVHDNIEEIRQIRSSKMGLPESLILHYVERQANDQVDGNIYIEDIWAKPWFRQPDLISVGGSDAIRCIEIVEELISKRTKILLWNFSEHLKEKYLQSILFNAQVFGNYLTFDIEPRR